MSEINFELCLQQILCEQCNEIKKISINYDRNKKLINLNFECGHKNKNQKDNLNDLNSIFCLNCKKILNNEIICNNEKHKKIEKKNLYFYCKTHNEFYKGYCEECNKNICEKCLCEHEIFKENFEYYFTIYQLNELIYKFEEVQNFFNTIYSIECNKQIINSFVNYYNSYLYIYENQYFHVNIIYALNLFYNFFILCINKNINDNGCFSIDKINNINDESIFYDDDFFDVYENLKDTNNFKNVLQVFILSKRMKKKTIHLIHFYDKIDSTLNKYLYESKELKGLIDSFDKNYLLLKHIILIKKGELINLENEINFQLLNLKLTKFMIPPNLKRKLINIVLRIIIKKFKNNLYRKWKKN